MALPVIRAAAVEDITVPIAGFQSMMGVSPASAGAGAAKPWTLQVRQTGHGAGTLVVATMAMLAPDAMVASPPTPMIVAARRTGRQTCSLSHAQRGRERAAWTRTSAGA